MWKKFYKVTALNKLSQNFPLLDVVDSKGSIFDSSNFSQVGVGNPGFFDNFLKARWLCIQSLLFSRTFPQLFI